MKKGLAIIIMVTMILMAIPPAVSGDLDGSITYNPGGGGNVDPIKILAIWESNSGDTYDLDDDTTSPGCQVDPPCCYEAYTDVWVYVAVLDPDDDIEYTTQIKFDISWPHNMIDYRPDLGDGSKAADNLEPVSWATWGEYVAADNIDYGYNSPFICYYNDANDGGMDGYDYVEWQWGESNVKFFKAKYELYYHDPAGWYDAEVTVQGTYTDFQYNYFEYVYTLCSETDFSCVNWGGEHELHIWHAYDGDWYWNPGMYLPTIRNLGNWDTELWWHFDSGDFNPNDALLDVRAGDSNPESPNYNPSIVECYGPTDHPDGYEGMYHCNWYGPLPIDNYDELDTDYYQDVLLKCHMMKLDFYLYVIQWTNGEGPYYFDIDYMHGDPMWQPAPGFPCPEQEQEE